MIYLILVLWFVIHLACLLFVAGLVVCTVGLPCCLFAEIVLLGLYLFVTFAVFRFD